MVQRLAAVAVSVWDRIQKHAECDWKKALADERADPVEAPVGPNTQPATESQESAPAAQHKPASSSMPAQNFQNEQMDSWSWEHKNAENAKERGQARRQQVKSLEDQW